MAAIYGLADPATGEIRYVGWSKHPERRYGQHCRASSVRRDRSPKGRWIATLAQDGLKPTLVILQADPADWDEAERAWINKLREGGVNLLNAQPGGAFDGSVYQRSSRSTGGRWGSLHRARQVLGAYPEKLNRVEAAIRRMAKRLKVTVADAEAIIESELRCRAA